MSRQAASSKPSAVRRIVKTVTQEVIEEIIPAYPPTETAQRRIAPRKPTVQAIVNRDSFSTPNTAATTKRVIPAVKKTILKRTTVNKAPLNRALANRPPVVTRNPYNRIAFNETSTKETPGKKTPVKQTPPMLMPTRQSPEKKWSATKPRQPQNQPKKVAPTKKNMKTTVRGNSTPKTPHTLITRKQVPSRSNFTLKSSKHQPAQPRSRSAKRTLKSAIAKHQPATNAKTGTAYKLISRSNEYSRSPSANLAPVLAPALYKSQLPALGSRNGSPSDANSYSASPTSRLGYGNVRNERQVLRVSPGSTVLGAAVKMEPTDAIKEENILAPPPRTRSVHDRIGKVNQTPRTASGTSYPEVSVKPEAEKRVKCEAFIGPPLRTSTVRNVKRTTRKSTGANSPPTADTMLTTRGYNRRGSSSTSREASSTRTAGIWVVTHETGYCSDGFHSYSAPVAYEVGTYMTRAAAISKGKQIVGDDFGYSWQEVCKSGGLQVISDTEQKWEIKWSPRDSRYSNVTAHFIPEGGGVWAVDAETGFMADRFHSHEEPTKKRLGLYLTRQLAVEEGKKQMGYACGWNWEKVSQNRFFEIRKDCAERWEGFWGPPGSEYTLIVVKRIGMPMGGVSAMR